MNDIGKNIKKLRQRNKLTQEELAETLRVTRQAVSNWETGKNQPDIDTLQTLAEVLKADIKELLYGPAPEEEKREKIVTASLLWALTAVAWIGFYVLWGKGNHLQSAHYDPKMNVFLLMALRPAAFLLLGAAAGSLLSVWRDLRPTTLRTQRRMLALGWGILLVYLLIAGLSFFSNRAFYVWLWWGRGQPWTFLFPGVALFCARKRKAG